MDPFEMPVPHLGQIVWWYPGGVRTAEPTVGIVTAISQRNVNLNILSPQNYNMTIRDYVRHLYDPDTRDNEKSESGCWDFTVWDKAIMRKLGIDGVGKDDPRVLDKNARRAS